MAWKNSPIPRPPHMPCVSIPWGSQGQMEEWQGTDTPDGPVHHPDAELPALHCARPCFFPDPAGREQETCPFP